jgi:VanZ family protein
MRPRIDSQLHFTPLWLIVGIILVITISALCLMPSGDLPPPFPHFDKVVHSIFYLMISGWFGQLVLPEGRWAIFTYSLLMGAILEVVQWFLPYRSFELWDIAANTSGNIIAIAIFTNSRFRPLKMIDHQIWSVVKRLIDA